MKRLVCGLSVFYAAGSLFAQTPSPTGSPLTPEEAAAAAAAAAGIFGVWGACCVFQFLLIIGSMAAWIFTGIWVMNDAKARNSENAQLVTILGWLVWPVGLIMHLVTRPKGNLVPCPNCQKKRLEGLATCPHCGQP